MTTNVIDKSKKILTTDSRWSIQLENECIAFVDNTGFDKMADRHQGTIICAGDAELIDQWRDWFLSPRINTAALPATERLQNGEVRAITISLVLKPDGQILFSNGWYYDFEDHAKFSGSGAVYAKDCYSVNRCGYRAVATAAAQDPMTGGETKFVEIETFRTNLTARKTTLKDVEEQLQSRGMFMDLKTRKIEPLNGNPGGDAVAKGLRSGSFSLSAPTGQPHRAWTDREKQDLRTAMDRLAELEEAAAK